VNVRVTPTFAPAPPWTDGQQVTGPDGTLYTFSASLNALSIVDNTAGIDKNANSFLVKNLPTPVAGGDAANKNYVDSKIPTGGGIGEAPTDGGTYARRNSTWIKTYDGGAY